MINRRNPCKANSLLQTPKDIFRGGFTLIEMSIVLVIIGLIVGGVLVGRDLIKAAEIRATISQVEKYNTAVNTFRGKYGFLPGDIPDPQATQFGFAARGAIIAEGDGNGAIQGTDAVNARGFAVISGETVMVWVDLSKAGLIDGSFNTATSTSYPSQTDPNKYFPAAKLGNNNFFYVENNAPMISSVQQIDNAKNWFGLSSTASITTGGWRFYSSPGLTVKQAYDIDQKIDDGLPMSGEVQAFYVNINVNIFGFAQAAGGGLAGANNTNATSYASTNCYDNNGVAGTQLYSVTQNAAQINCALSFKMQE